MAGLLAARVLADHFERVTIVDRDRFPESPAFRKGVPQSRHAHILLVRGREILDQLFPGLKADLVAAGAPIVDFSADFRMLSVAGWVPRLESPYKLFACSRDLLEWTVRRQLAADRRVCFLQERDVTELLPNADKTGVVGVRVRGRNRAEGDVGGEEELRVDLVVDASGRSSRAVGWLEDLGYPAPQETIINSFLGYASRFYVRPPNLEADWKALMIAARPPANPRGGALFPLEGDRWLVTLAGAGRDYPPTEEAGFLEFARSLASPILYEAIKDAQPLSPIYGYQRTENRLLHYERMPRWPAGFVAIGDAVCAFNPIYGQGMTTAALGALTLDHLLRAQRLRQPSADLDGAAWRFQQQLAKSNQAAWLMATGEDFRYPTTEGGKRSPITRLMHWYMNRVIETVAVNNDVYMAFSATLHLLKPPASLFHPSVMGRVLRHQVNGRGGDKVTG
jgi:2-polyprenyl-6-methoxyphenol hydroxylase-like FAD-dependent oxidoreductase